MAVQNNLYDLVEPSVKCDDLPGALPSGPVPKDADLSSAPHFLETALRSLDENSLTKDAIWKDWYALTDSFRTHNSSTTVVEAWSKHSSAIDQSSLKVQPGRLINFLDKSWVNVVFNFKTAQSSRGLAHVCDGYAQLVHDHAAGDWKVWVLVTVLRNLEGQRNPDIGPTFPAPSPMRTADGSEVFSTVVIGAGQSGLSLGGRLHALGVSYVVLDKADEVGSAWKRYESITQHTARDFNSLPFEYTYAASEPMLLPAEKVVEGFKRYVDKFQLNIWLETEAQRCEWLSDQKLWKVSVKQPAGVKVIMSRHLAFTIGAGLAAADVPKLPGQDSFSGELVPHPQYKHARSWRGKRGLVIGSGTMAHDVARDMHEAGMPSVTMVQRQKTAVFPVEWLLIPQSAMYNPSVPLAIADLFGSTGPSKIGRELNKASFAQRTAADPLRHERLKRAGFLLDEETTVVDLIFERYGGYYIDVGTSNLICDGTIKMKNDSPLAKLTPTGAEFADASHVDADVIVVATGYSHNYKRDVQAMLGSDIAERIDTFWGLDANGDLRGILKPHYPGALWLQGGSVGQARYLSRFIALQILERELVEGHLTSGDGVNGKVNGTVNGS